MWWKILIGFFVLRGMSQKAPAAQAAPSGVMPMTMQPPITSPMMQANASPAFVMRPPITSPMQQPGAFTFQSNGPLIVSPLFDNAGPQKIMQPAPAFGGSQGFQF